LARRMVSTFIAGLASFGAVAGATAEA